MRDEELEDLDKLVVDGCPLSLKKDLLATVSGKVNCLIQVITNSYAVSVVGCYRKLH